MIIRIKTVITVLFIVIIYSWPINAIEITDNSYYQYNMNVGERISTIDNQLHLSYHTKFNEYSLLTNLDISKRYRFLAGIKRERDIRYDNYFLELSKNQTRLKLGLVEAKSKIQFLSLGKILGGYFAKDNYEVWIGNSIREDLGFSSQSNLQFGLNYSLDSKKLSYNAITEEDEYNQYLSYQDNFSLLSGNLYAKLNAGFNLSDQLSGLSNKLSFNSQYQGFSYTLTGGYTAPQFVAIRSQSDKGSGSYYFNLASNKKIASVLLSSNLNYRRNNLNQELDQTTHNWNSNWQCNYYHNANTQYYLNLKYTEQRSYPITKNIAVDRTNEFETKLGTEINNLSGSISYNLVEESNYEQNVDLQIDYLPKNYELSAQYSWSSQTGWQKHFLASYNYLKRFSSKLNYDLLAKFSKREREVINLRQKLRYKFSQQHNLIMTLNLSKELELPAVEKSFIFRYKYQF